MPPTRLWPHLRLAWMWWLEEMGEFQRAYRYRRIPQVPWWLRVSRSGRSARSMLVKAAWWMLSLYVRLMVQLLWLMGIARILQVV